METDYLVIAESPAAEECVGVGEDNYMARSRKECIAFINQLRREHGDEPFGARLQVAQFNHDFGPYLTVACYYNNQEGLDYAMLCEDGIPEHWDAEALRELGIIRPIRNAQ